MFAPGCSTGENGEDVFIARADRGVTLRLCPVSTRSNNPGGALPLSSPPLTQATLASPVSTGSATLTFEGANDHSPDPASFTLVILHPEDGGLVPLLALHAGQAAQLNRKPLVEFSAGWCPPCQALAESLPDARMIDAFRGTYIIRLDIDEWESQLGRTDVPFVGIPTFFELNSDGQPSGRTISGAAWGEDIPENMAPPLKEFFQAASP